MRITPTTNDGTASVMNVAVETTRLKAAADAAGASEGERDDHREGEELCEEHELECHGNALEDFGEHWPSRRERRSPIPGEHAPDPVEEPREEALVEAQRVAEFRTLSLGRFLAEQDERRVAWHEKRQLAGEGRDDKQHPE